MKDTKKCKTCAYHLGKGDTTELNGTYDYMTITGHSRIVKEMADGSYGQKECTSWRPKSDMAEIKAACRINLPGSRKHRRKKR